MTFPRVLGTHHHLPDNVAGLEAYIQALIDEALADFEGGGGGEAGPAPWPVLESLTGQTDGSTASFPTTNVFVEGSTRVFAEGLLLEPEIDWAEAPTGDGVVLAWAPMPGTQLAVEYLAAVI
jgi:hypothetical protein